ncbi:hypothetical protein [Streptomyces sp. NPDC055749]
MTKWDYVLGPAMVTAVEAVTTMLVDTAVADGGTRISVHLSDQDGQACVVALSHQVALTAGHDTEDSTPARRTTPNWSAHRTSSP